MVVHCTSCIMQMQPQQYATVFKCSDVFRASKSKNLNPGKTQNLHAVELKVIINPL